MRTLTLLLFLTTLLAQPAAAVPNRYALVIGNAAYTGERPLVNTLNDARDVAATLRGLGFSVTERHDLGLRAMRRQVNRFLGDIQGRGGLALIYYSGHGVQDGARRNYLLPVDAQVERAADVKAEGVAVDGILDELARRPDGAVSLVILDACRDNPFAGARGGKGLGRVAPPGGTLVLYAASPGQTASDNPGGKNGLFTGHLLAEIARPGVDIEDSFDRVALAVQRDSGRRQLPYKEGNLLGKHYLGGEPVAPAAGPGAVDYDYAAWQTAERCGRPACYRAYLSTYPAGRFAAMARALTEPAQRPEPPEPPVADPAAVEAALGLDRADRRRIQQALNAIGVPVGAADGIWGRATRGGIENWQAKQGLVASGYLDAAGYKALLAEAANARPAAQPRQSFEPEMVRIPGGSFQMGSNDGASDEKPVHRVQIQPFLMGKYEVTQAQWRAVMGSNPSSFSGCDRCPVEQVSWDEVQTYIRKLNAKTGRSYRLPSEAEWEYAARAGTTTPFSTGRCINTRQANYDGNYDYKSCGAKTGVYREKTLPVGSLAANPWGLYDVHGNVWEWVEDCWNDSYSGAPADGSAWTGGDCGRRVLRGGSWGSGPGWLRSAYRLRGSRDFRDGWLGLRLARAI